MGDLVQNTETVFIRDWLKSVGGGEGAEQIASGSSVFEPLLVRGGSFNFHLPIEVCHPVV